MTARRIRRTRRTVRSATLVAVAAAAAFSLTACQSGSDDAAGSQKKDSASASHATGGGADSGETSRAGSGKNQTDVRTQAQGDNASSATSTSAASRARSETLVDGSTAKIYKLGSQHYRAKIVNDGDVLATLETKQSDAGLDANGMFVTLTLDGQIHSWMGGDQQGPGTFDLEGGWTAKVTKAGENHYRAKIIGHDGVAATLNANQHDVGLNANGVYIVLSAGGVISAHA